MKNTRVPTNYAVTRGQKRYIARRKMEEEGKKKVCKSSYTGIKKGNFVTQHKNPSYFAEHWREYVEVSN